MKQSKLKECGVDSIEVHNYPVNEKVIDIVKIGTWFELELMTEIDISGTTHYYLRLGDESYEVLINANGKTSVNKV